jgi:plasmid stabilization system protein ParE
MSKPVVTALIADLQILEIDAWWRANRDKSPDLFEEELALAFRMLSTAPGVGKRCSFAGATVRRVLLRATRNHVYYVEETDRVLVVAVWGAVKGAGPDLSGL